MKKCYIGSMSSTLDEIAKSLVAPNKGILAADESTGSIEKRFAEVGIESNEENRRAYRELLFTTPEIESYLSGVIMYDETAHQKDFNGVLFPEVLKSRGIIPGIKVDKGTVELANFPGEKITEGLDGLRERLAQYKQMGFEFTKWRAVIAIGEQIPTTACIRSNIHALTRFAALSQEAGMVPIVEPEILMDGNHTSERCKLATTRTLEHLFAEMFEHHIHLPGMLLKVNMILPGKDSDEKLTSEEIAKLTLETMRESVTVAVPGIVFLSGGQTSDEATENLYQINKVDKAPWQLTFSFGRALQRPALEAWLGRSENWKAAQQAFLEQVKKNSLAREGKK